jgi:hypothetical protein
MLLLFILIFISFYTKKKPLLYIYLYNIYKDLQILILSKVRGENR